MSSPNPDLEFFAKEQIMKRYPFLALPIAASCIVISSLIAVLSLLVISMASIDLASGLPFTYFQQLNLPMLSVLLPFIGMVALLPIALQLAFGHEATLLTAEQVPASEPIALVEPPQEEHYLKAA
jgi:hypothetical protein